MPRVISSGQNKTANLTEEELTREVEQAVAELARVRDATTAVLSTINYTFGAEAAKSASKKEEDTGGDDFSLNSCLCYIIYLTLFLIMAQLGRTRQSGNYYISHGMFNQLNGWTDAKEFSDIASVPEFYTYLLEGAFLDYILPDGTDYFVQQGAIDGFVGGQNLLLGGLRVVNVRSKNVTCGFEDLMSGDVTNDMVTDVMTRSNDTTCYSESEVDTNPWYLEGYGEIEYDEGKDDTTYIGIVKSYSPGGHVIYLNGTWAETIAEIEKLKLLKFVDRATRVLFIDFQTYNANWKLHTIGRSVLELPISGGVWIDYEVKTWNMFRYIGMTGYILVFAEFMFYSYLVWYTFIEFTELYDLGFKAYCASKWNIMQMTNNIVLWLNVWWRITSMVKTPSSEEMLNANEFHSFRYTVFLMTWESYFYAINGFLMFVMIFKHLTFSKKLRFLFDLVSYTAYDLMYFLIVLMIFMMTFAVSGYMLFGGDVDYFRTIPNAWANLLRFLVFEIDYERLKFSHRSWAAIFVTGWVVCTVLILVNVFIAILLDAYTELREMNDKDDQGDGHGIEELKTQFTDLKRSITTFGSSASGGCCGGRTRVELDDDLDDEKQP